MNISQILKRMQLPEDVMQILANGGLGDDPRAVVQAVTPHNLKVTIMHEGASGSGKSEMNEHVHRGLKN